MAKRKFKKAKPNFEQAKVKKEEKLFETEYLKKVKNFIDQIQRKLKKWQE